jgi:hypothetical protein
MVTIYCIEDINDLKYVGSTKKKLCDRFGGHRSDKKRNNYCSSSKLNLDYCIIYSLETCNESERSEREKYWINKIDCVNDVKINFDRPNHYKEYQKKNKVKLNKYNSERYLFRSTKVVNGCYEFIKMLEQY